MLIQKKGIFFLVLYTYYAGLLVKKGTCCIQNQILYVPENLKSTQLQQYLLKLLT